MRIKYKEIKILTIFVSLLLMVISFENVSAKEIVWDEIDTVNSKEVETESIQLASS